MTNPPTMHTFTLSLNPSSTYAYSSIPFQQSIQPAILSLTYTAPYSTPATVPLRTLHHPATTPHSIILLAHSLPSLGHYSRLKVCNLYPWIYHTAPIDSGTNFPRILHILSFSTHTLYPITHHLPKVLLGLLITAQAFHSRMKSHVFKNSYPNPRA